MRHLFFLLFCSIVFNVAKSQTIPSQNEEYCPNTQYTFTATIPKAYSSMIGVGGCYVTQLPTPPYGTTITFKGVFGDANQKQTFRVIHPDASFTDLDFKKIKSLFFTTTCSQISNQAQVLFPLCQVTSRVVTFPKVQWSTTFENPDFCFGTIDDYEYLIPAGWKIGSTISTGSEWIPGSNSATITSDLNTGNGDVIKIRARNICAPGIFIYNNQTPATIPISRPAPLITINGDMVICSGFKTYTLNGLPAGATVSWAISDVTRASIPIPSIGTSVDVTRVTTENVSVTLTAYVTACGITYPVPKDIYLGEPNFGAYYNNGKADYQPLAYFDPTSPTSINKVCIGYNNYTATATPSSGAVIWSLDNNPPSYAINWQQEGNTVRFRYNYAGIYPLVIFKCIVTNGCGTVENKFAFKQVNCNQIGGVDPCTIFAFRMSPNPATNQEVRIDVDPNLPMPVDCTKLLQQYNSSDGITISQVNIYSNLGVLLKSVSADKVKEILINLNGLLTGTYLVEIIDGTYSERKYLIVQ